MNHNAPEPTLTELRKKPVAAAILLAVVWLGGMLAAAAMGWGF
jgi:hypothetical protein